MGSVAIDTFLEGLKPDARAIVDALREIIVSSHSGLAESIKWNAPSFSHNGEHKITLGLTKANMVQVVIHRGAKKKDAATFSFNDPARLAWWPAKDRGVLIFHNVEEVTTRAQALGDLFHNWIETTA